MEELNNHTASEFRELKEIEYFDFEEDFIEENIRCIPMQVRFKMDAAGIKLKLAEWCKFTVDERKELALKTCATEAEALLYNKYLAGIIEKHTGNQATFMAIDKFPGWASLHDIPNVLQEKLNEMKWNITVQQWQALTNIQRFALLKLCRPGHENKNFPKAMQEFGLLNL